MLKLHTNNDLLPKRLLINYNNIINTKNMDFTQQQKQEIAELLKEKFANSGLTSQAAFARTIGLHKSDVSNVLSGKFIATPTLIGNGKWVTMAYEVHYTTNKTLDWKTAETEPFKFISAQLNLCKIMAFTGIFVDEPGIGKTYTCKHFADNNPNVYYIDCSCIRNNAEFISTLARKVGIESNNKLSKLVDNIIFSLQNTATPLVILDEAGELKDTSYREIKRLYNMLRYQCGFYLVGSDGLRNKIDSGIRNDSQGFKELFDRFGKNYLTYFSSKNVGVQRSTMAKMALEVLIANGITNKQQQDNIISLMHEGAYIKSLRTVEREIVKIRQQQQQKQ